MNDVMLDLETLGNGKDKCVCQIGAIFFDNSTGELGNRFKVNVDAASHMKLGAQMDAPTVYWWLKQSKEAQNSITSGELVDITTAITQLNEFLRPAKRIWSHATFDFVTIQETFKQCGVKPTFKYSAGLDLRTLTYLGGVKVDKIAREGIHHDALDDCIYQVKYCVSALNAVKTSKKLVSFLNGIQE